MLAAWAARVALAKEQARHRLDNLLHWRSGEVFPLAWPLVMPDDHLERFCFDWLRGCNTGILLANH